jgi:hypothetical protein
MEFPFLYHPVGPFSAVQVDAVGIAGMKASMKFIYGVAVWFGLFVLPANAAQDEGGWDYFLAGYLTAVSIDADTTAFTPVGDQTIPVDLSFSDVLDTLGKGASGVVSARKGPISINLDMVYADLETSTSGIDIDVGLREYELFVGYAAFQQYPDLEIIAGGRYIKQDITLDLKILVPGIPPKLNIGDDWIDPFIGLRYRGPIAENWNWILRGDIGGFGVGSDFAWRIDAGASYRFGEQKKWQAALFYKVLDIDYETGSSGTPSIYKWDGTESGITLGVGYHF